MLAAGLAVLASGCGGSSPATAPTTPDVFAGQPTRSVDEQLIRGGQLYVTDGCQACHSVNGRDLGGPSFHNLAARRSDAQLLRAVMGHIALHPPSPALVALAHQPRAARALVTFIESITSG
jgi:mono/diheme cytochrome c family protein